MTYQDFVRLAAGVLAGALLAGGTVAQTKQPEPTTMTDTAPSPAQDRSSVGAVILMDEPVLAQREAMQQAQARSGIDTRSMGAGPNRIMRRALTREELEFQRALEEAERQRGGTPK
jgi:acetyl-CoA acetyltransferase